MKMLVRVSLIYRRPLHELMQWPSAHLSMIAKELSARPCSEERIEYALAQLTYYFVESKRAPNSKKLSVSDFILFKEEQEKPKSNSRYSDVDMSFLQHMI